MYQLEIKLQGLPPLSNTHVHWRKAGKQRKLWRSAVELICKSRAKPEEPLKKACLFLERHSSAEPDYDNLVISFKSIIDGLKDAGIILDDKSSVIVHRNYTWHKTSIRDGHVIVRVEQYAEQQK